MPKGLLGDATRVRRILEYASLFEDKLTDARRLVKEMEKLSKQIDGLAGTISAQSVTPVPAETKIAPISNPSKAGWSYQEFAAATGVSRSFLYSLPDAIKPKNVKIGRRVVINETPQAWIKRYAKWSEANG